MADRFKSGDWYVVDDVAGTKIYHSDSKRQWDGLLTEKSRWRPRQQQDLIRGREDRMSAPETRPRPVPTFIGPLTTEVAGDTAAGSATLAVLSTVRMEDGDRLSIMLDNGAPFNTTITSIDGTTLTLTLASPMPWSSAQGNVVVNNTAMSIPDL